MDETEAHARRRFGRLHRFGKQAFPSETLRLVGYVPAGAFISYFDEPVAPFGTASFVVPVFQS